MLRDLWVNIGPFGRTGVICFVLGVVCRLVFSFFSGSVA